MVQSTRVDKKDLIWSRYRCEEKMSVCLQREWPERRERMGATI